MAFDSKNLAKKSTGQTVNVPTGWDYDTTDNKAAVIASGYFNNYADYLKVGHKIDVNYDTDGTPGSISLRIASNNGTTVTTEEWGTGLATVAEVVYIGTHTTAGGGASENITVTGALATDHVVCQLKTEGATPVTLDRAAAAANAIALTFSADPSTDHVVTYVVYRAVS